MKFATAAQAIAAVSLSSQAILGVEAKGNLIAILSGSIDSPSDDGRKLLEEDASGVDGHVVMGSDGDSGIFVATNATNFPQGIINGALRVAISDTEECNSDALGRALKFHLEVPVAFEINELGMIEGSERGWFEQTIRELQGNSTLPVSLAELVNEGRSDSEDGLAVYLLSSDEELLGCASMKKLDNVDKAAEYYASLTGLSQDQEAVKEEPSSGNKIGLFVSLFAIAAVGTAFLLGDVLSL